jgi:hypothetical protein
MIIEAVVDLAGTHQVIALQPAEMDTVELVDLQREAGDRQCLTLRAGFLDTSLCRGRPDSGCRGPLKPPVEPGRADVLVHLVSVDRETFAELNRGLGSFFRWGLRPHGGEITPAEEMGRKKFKDSPPSRVIIMDEERPINVEPVRIRHSARMGRGLLQPRPIRRR